MRFFDDQCVPESVAKTLERHGHEVIRRRERIAPDSPGTLVAAVSEANNAILVTMDGDAKTIASRYGVGSRRYRRLSILRFERCRESRAAKRIDEAMSLIEHEWEVGGGRESQDRRMFVVITDGTIRTNRQNAEHCPSTGSSSRRCPTMVRRISRFEQRFTAAGAGTASWSMIR